VGVAEVPDVDLVLQPGETIVGALGSASGDCCDQRVVCLGFWSSLGRQYGPYGGDLSDASVFTFLGNIYGFFGGLSPYNNYVSGIGFWTDAPSPPPAPPFRPPPPLPPSSNSPSPPPVYNSGRVQGPTLGDFSSYTTYWDDGPNYRSTTP
jgi:hypothetical protein